MCVCVRAANSTSTVLVNSGAVGTSMEYADESLVRSFSGCLSAVTMGHVSCVCGATQKPTVDCTNQPNVSMRFDYIGVTCSRVTHPWIKHA